MQELNLNPRSHHGEREANVLIRDVVRFQIAQMDGHELLTHEEEIEFARMVRTAIYIGRDKNGRPTEIFDPTIEGAHPKALWAREQLVKHNQRLVMHNVKNYLQSRVPTADLYQEGCIGLQRAAEKFNPEMGHRFSTYATRWIKQAITRAIADQVRTIRVPTHMHESIGKVRKAIAQLTAIHNRPPCEEEIAERIEVTVDKLRAIIASSPHIVSLDLEFGEKKDFYMVDAIAGPDYAEQAYDEIDNSVIFTLLDEMGSERLRQVLTLRYGLDGNGAHTLEEIGAMLGFTRERARQLENRAKTRLFELIKKKGLTREDLLSA